MNIDYIFIITLPHRADRLQNITTQLPQFGYQYEVFYGVNGKAIKKQYECDKGPLQVGPSQKVDSQNRTEQKKDDGRGNVFDFPRTQNKIVRRKWEKHEKDGNCSLGAQAFP